MTERPKHNADVFYTMLDEIAGELGDLKMLNPGVGAVMKKIVTAIPAEMHYNVPEVITAFTTLQCFLIDQFPDPDDRRKMREAVAETLLTMTKDK